MERLQNESKADGMAEPRLQH